MAMIYAVFPLNPSFIPREVQGQQSGPLSLTLNCQLNLCSFHTICHLVLIWVYCDGRVDFIDWAGGDIGSGMLSRVGDGSERCKFRYVTLY
jgi:hypothetical protein